MSFFQKASYGVFSLLERSREREVGRSELADT
jgi:hypothetical protein